MRVHEEAAAKSSEKTSGDNSSYLEKISPKDLVMFSPSTRKQIAKVRDQAYYKSLDTLVEVQV